VCLRVVPLLLVSMQYEQVLKPLMDAYIDSTRVSGSRCTRLDK
jgi:hypothetical protein